MFIKVINISHTYHIQTVLFAKTNTVKFKRANKNNINPMYREARMSCVQLPQNSKLTAHRSHSNKAAR